MKKTQILMNKPVYLGLSYECNERWIFLFAKYLYEVKYQYLINKLESTGSNHLNDSKAFIEYWNDMDDIYNDIEEYNLNKERQILIVFDDIIADMLRDRKRNPIVTELFIGGGKLNISLVFITQHYCFVETKVIRISSAQYFINNIPNIWELQQIVFNHSSDIDFIRFYESLQKMYCKSIFFFSEWCYSCNR